MRKSEHDQLVDRLYCIAKSANLNQIVEKNSLYYSSKKIIGEADVLCYDGEKYYCFEVKPVFKGLNKKKAKKQAKKFFNVFGCDNIFVVATYTPREYMKFHSITCEDVGL